MEETKVKKKSTTKKKTSKDKEKIKELESKVNELEEKLLRNQAELQNYKRRKEEEIEKIRLYSQEDLLKEMLPIFDNFERAIDMDDENLEDEVSKFLEGFKMIYVSFVNVMDNLGVEEIEAFGKKFDPNFHQALLTDEIEGKENEEIIEVLQKGYKLRERVIRPAMVRVNIKNKEKEKENEEDE
ncbi:MAG: nucleotide exchange factor GrpE [Bacilli bacterium]